MPKSKINQAIYAPNIQIRVANQTFGDPLTSNANLLYDASLGQIAFRTGTTTNAVLTAAGVLTFEADGSNYIEWGTDTAVASINAILSGTSISANVRAVIAGDATEASISLVADSGGATANLKLYTDSALPYAALYDVAAGLVGFTIGANASPNAMLDVRGAIVGTTTLTITGAFGCNGTTAQTAYASGGALAAYGAGANGFDTAGHASALYAMVVAIRAALVANGIMS